MLTKLANLIGKKFLIRIFETIGFHSHIFINVDLKDHFLGKKKARPIIPRETPGP